ncbi:hypothetical protein GOL38_04350 [Sinorhizobium medicae]|nr:hypothetical protein [Sinorhizobium medicae]
MTFEVDTRTININTVVSVAGFLATFVFIGIAWGASQAALSDLEEWRIQHEGVHRDLVGAEKPLNALELGIPICFEVLETAGNRR